MDLTFIKQLVADERNAQVLRLQPQQAQYICVLIDSHATLRLWINTRSLLRIVTLTIAHKINYRSHLSCVQQQHHLEPTNTMVLNLGCREQTADLRRVNSLAEACVFLVFFFRFFIFFISYHSLLSRSPRRRPK